MQFQYLSSRKLLELKLAGSGSDLLLLSVTLLAFNEQRTCQPNEIRTGNHPFLECAAGSDGRTVSLGLCLSEGGHDGVPLGKDLHVNPHEINLHLLLQGAEGLFLQKEEGTGEHVGEMLFLLDSHACFSLHFCLICFHRN